MSDETNQDLDASVDTSETPNEPFRPEDELKMLKERAKTLGIPISGNIGLDTLRKKIEAKLTGSEPEAAQGGKQDSEETAEMDAAPKTKRQLDKETRLRLKKEKMYLVRCRIYNLNPAKRDLRGEIVTVANKFLGTVRKFIPFGEATDNGYHIPKCLYDDLKARKFQQVRTNPKTGEVMSTRMVPEYSLEVLPQLTKEELQELGNKQAAAERLGSE